MAFIEKVLVVATFVFSLFLNALAARGFLSAQSIGTVSSQYPTYLTPDMLTFLVWAVTYTLEGILVVMQCSTSESAEKALQQRCCLTSLSVRWRLVIAFLLNALWLPLYANMLFGKSMLVILVYLVFLLLIYVDINTMTTCSLWQWVVYGSGVACNISWVLVATAANKFTLAASYGWMDAYGVAGTPHTAVLVIAILAAVSLLVVTVRSDFAWSLVAVWFFGGLYRQHTVSDGSFPPEAMNRMLSLCALWASVVVGMATAVGIFLIRDNGAFKSKDSKDSELPLAAE
ncbi:unnamed protein product [Symbiodinium natans]|uniref:Uncharacterized protein n=1 Tax=Symbiodinium natans TaxID=878477 RepID=A0A812GS31_9DINO|nr:unnamed protein product [Symbiodinium natans]